MTAADVKGLAIELDDAKSTYKNGACSHLFTTYQITASDIVNGCACRDVGATLRIGDLNETPLHRILSPDNQVYMRLIEEQPRRARAGVPKLRVLDYYKSIYHSRAVHRKDGRKFQSIDAFKNRPRAVGAHIDREISTLCAAE